MCQNVSCFDRGRFSSWTVAHGRHNDHMALLEPALLLLLAVVLLVVWCICPTSALLQPRPPNCVARRDKMASPAN